MSPGCGKNCCVASQQGRWGREPSNQPSEVEIIVIFKYLMKSASSRNLQAFHRNLSHSTSRKNFFVSIYFVIQTPGYMHTHLIFSKLHLWAGYIMNVPCSAKEIYTMLMIIKQLCLSLSTTLEREMKKQTKFHFNFRASVIISRWERIADNYSTWISHS